MSMAHHYQELDTQTRKRRTLMISSEVCRALKKEDSLATNFLTDTSVPAWYRGTSQFQIEAADALLNAIRDDTEQRTAHRVRAILGQIGIEPTITVAETKLLMRLSRGNDLTFLWFLMELHYKTPGLYYSVNEQLIMSTMCHLDMIPTMRELDRILPPSSLSKKEWLKRKSREQQKPQPLPRPSASKPHHGLPYFKRQVRPRNFGKTLSKIDFKVPDFKVCFGVYENYKNPYYVVPNESNRWYANYELQTSKRIVNHIITDEIGHLFEDFTGASLNNNQLEALCEHHKVIKCLENSLEDELRVIARDRCEQYFDADKRRREERETRIRDMLEKDVRRYLCKFRKLTAKTKKEMVVMTIASECDCQNHLVDIKDEPCDQSEVEAFFGEAREKRTSMLKENGSNKEGGKDLPFDGGMGDYFDGIASGDSREKIMYRRASKGRISIDDNLARLSSNVFDGIGYRRSMRDTDREDSTSIPSQMFFEAPANHKPYLFDYSKIFSFKGKDKNKFHVNRTIIEALDSEVSVNTTDSRLNLDDAVRDCVTKMWRRELARKNAEFEEDAEREHVESQHNENSPLNFNQEYYDSGDKVLMSRMLKGALEHMSRNPKFVLASLPAAHKMPILREWICRRYGKVYTKAERFRAYHTSLKVFRALDRVTLEVPLPSARELGTQLAVDYSCRDYLLKKANNISNNYYNRLDAAIMDQSRVLWFAMRPYLCSSGPPRNTYYAYMPARMMDILHFPWKPSEFMDAKSEWERRMNKWNEE